jgi:hypothetical protein
MIRFFLLLIFVTQFLVSNTLAHTAPLAFMTSRDLIKNDRPSNINLHNSRTSAATVYGLYVRQFAYVTPGDTCDHATTIYASATNTTVGSVVMPISIGAGTSAAIGKNYLYNMIYAANYYVQIIIPVSTPGCALPGCTWGSDTTMYNWCIYLGALSPVSTTAGYTANVPPAAEVASSAGQYNYNLISSYITLGPISCDDQALTCTAATQQTQSFS